MNIKNILTLQFMGIVAGILLVFSVFTFQFSNIFRQNEFQDRLEQRVATTLKLLLDSQEVDADFVKIIYKSGLNVFRSQRLFVFTSNGSEYFKSHPDLTSFENKVLLELREPSNVEPSIHTNKSDTDYVAFIYPHQNEVFYVVASAVDEVGYKRLNTLIYILSVLFCASLIITAFSGRIFARQALKPISEVVDQVDNITATNLYERVNEGNGKDEIAHLAITFNKMLARIENSFALQKSFVSNASHEFRTPLTVMKGQVEVLLLQKRTEAEYIGTLKSLIEDINNQIDLINGLHELAKANADFPDTRFTDVPIAEFLIEAREELLRLKPWYKIYFNFGNFPEDEDKVNVRGSYSLLKSAIINIMDNACKFSPNQTCDLKLEFEEKQCNISVTDKGFGISAEDLPHIYEPFYRSNNTRSITGHGIGMYLVKKIIDLHNGHIHIRSQVKQGTTVELTLPNLVSGTE